MEPSVEVSAPFDPAPKRQPAAELTRNFTAYADFQAIRAPSQMEESMEPSHEVSTPIDPVPKWQPAAGAD